MSKQIVSVEEVKKALNIDSFRNLSKDKIMEFVSLIPSMDKEVAISIINQFPIYGELATKMVAELTGLCDNALKENSVSQKESIEAYKIVLSQLGELLKKDDISAEERTDITNKMIMIADKIAAKDSENKEFLGNIIKYGSSVIGGALFLGAIILGVNTKGKSIPKLK